MLQKTLKFVLVAVLAAFGVAAFAVQPATQVPFGADALIFVGAAGLILNRSTIADMNRGFQTLFNGAFSSAKTDHELLCTVVPSTTSEEKYAWLGQMFNIREWLGSRVLQNLSSHNYTIVNKDYEGTISVPSNAVKDDQYGVYKPVFEDMGDTVKKFPSKLVFPLLKAGFSTLCYDGQYFFDSDHPVGTEDTGITSVSNTGGGSGEPWFLVDLSRKIKPVLLQEREPFKMVMKNQPTDDNVFFDKELIYGVDGRMNVGFSLWQLAYGSKATLDATNFNAAYAAMQNFKGDHGNPLGITPTHLFTTPTNRSAAMTLLEMQLTGGGNNNPNYKAVQLVISPWLV